MKINFISFVLFFISVIAASFMGKTPRYSFTDCWTVHLYIRSTLSSHSSSTLWRLDTANQISTAQRFWDLWMPGKTIQLTYNGSCKIYGSCLLINSTTTGTTCGKLCQSENNKTTTTTLLSNTLILSLALCVCLISVQWTVFTAYIIMSKIHWNFSKIILIIDDCQKMSHTSS